MRCLISRALRLIIFPAFLRFCYAKQKMLLTSAAAVPNNTLPSEAKQRRNPHIIPDFTIGLFVAFDAIIAYNENMLEVILWLIAFYAFYHINVACFAFIFRALPGNPGPAGVAAAVLLLTYIVGWKYIVKSKDPWKTIAFVCVIVTAIFFGYTGH